MNEQRQYARINNPLSVKYRIVNKVFASSSNSRNVSERGICLPLTHRFEPGVVLALKIYITELDMSFEAKGEIVWLKEQNNNLYPYLVGIKFIDMSGIDQNKLIRYITKFGPPPKKDK